jgi:ribosomal-protein-alanine N-acetyltransferase
MNEKVFEHLPQLETARLAFRLIEAEHAGVVFKLNSDLEALRFVARDPYTKIDQAADRVAEFETGYKERKAIWWAFYPREANEPIGYGGLFDINREWNKAEIGYGLLQNYWGNGYAGEAVAEMVRFGRDDLGLHRIYGKVVPGNTASVRILEKLGFEKEGRLKDDAFARGRYFDMCVFALINPHSG